MAKAYEISAEEASKLAVKNQRMNKGIKSLTDNWKDWKKELNKTDKLTTDYADAVSDVTDAIADLVGASDDLELPDEFFNDENMKLIDVDKNAIQRIESGQRFVTDIELVALKTIFNVTYEELLQKETQD